MERFKSYERESKSRDYKRSKFNKGKKETDENHEMMSWLKSSVVELEKNHKAIEDSISILESKDGGDADQLEEDANEIAELDERAELHKLHIGKNERRE
ncbi:hypothetical protein M1146_05445 [Patescibacteria group bacterium]|nr:hypothetical protein [Patescibacteria group bacterium]